MKNQLITSLFTAGALALVAAAPLSAKDHHDDAFAAMDPNGDGKVSESEHLAFSRALFKQSDADGDFRVTAAEWDAAAAAAKPDQKMDPAETAAQLRLMDLDGDSKVSDAESDAYARSVFAKADKDRDGFLTKSEYKAANKERQKTSKQKA